jgi:hypothetical protein
MTKKICALLSVVGVLVLTASLILAQGPPAGQGGGAPGAGGGGRGGPGGGQGRGGGGAGGGVPAIKPVPGKTGLYMVTGLGGNNSSRDGRGSVVVDTKNLGEANYNQLMDQIKTVSQAPQSLPSSRTYMWITLETTRSSWPEQSCCARESGKNPDNTLGGQARHAK